MDYGQNGREQQGVNNNFFDGFKAEMPTGAIFSTPEAPTQNAETVVRINQLEVQSEKATTEAAMQALENMKKDNFDITGNGSASDQEMLTVSAEGGVDLGEITRNQESIGEETAAAVEKLEDTCGEGDQFDANKFSNEFDGLRDQYILKAFNRTLGSGINGDAKAA
jgi:hypothetical protein